MSRALRALASRPCLTAAAISTLALGLGVNAAIFSLTRELLLRRLPYRDAGRLVMVSEANPALGIAYAPVAPASYTEWRRRVASLDLTAGFRAVDFNVVRSSRPVRLKGFLVEPTFFPLLGVEPALGRAFTGTDAQPGHDNVVLLSDGVWRREFAANPAVVGSSIDVDGAVCTIVGVLPRNFRIYRVLDHELDLWRPLVVDPTDREQTMLVYARLRQGTPIDAARSEARSVYASLATRREDWTAEVSSLSTRFAANARPTLVVLEGAAGVVLLIACANVANLLLAAAAGRRKELAVRLALGGGRWRIARELAAETFVLAAAGAALGALGAAWIVAFVNGRVSFQNLNRLEPFRVDWAVLSFTGGIAILAAAAFGLLPARHAADIDVVDALKESSHGATAGIPSRRLRQWLVLGQIALSVVLLASALALARGALMLIQMDRGLETAHVTTAQLALNGRTYDATGSLTSFAANLLGRVRSAAGVARAALVNYPPLSVIGTSVPISIEGRHETVGRNPFAQYWIVSPGYFETLGIPTLSGRDFTDGDSADRTRVAIVSRRMAERYWGRTDVVGQRFTPLFGSESTAVWIPRGGRRPVTVVGVVADVREDGIPGAPEDRLPQIYLPYAQNPTRVLTVIARAAGGLAAARSAIRDAAAAVDPEQPVFDERTLDEVRRETFAKPRQLAWVIGAFAVLATVLAAVGVYGVMSYLTAARTREIAIRMAVGASPADVVRLVVGDAMRVVTGGLVVGIAGAPLALRFARAALFGASPIDLPLLAAVAVAMAIVATSAAAIPAVRAARAPSLRS